MAVGQNVLNVALTSIWFKIWSSTNFQSLMIFVTRDNVIGSRDVTLWIFKTDTRFRFV